MTSDLKTIYRVSIPQKTVDQIERLAGQEDMRPGEFLSQLMRRCDKIGAERPGMLLAELTTLAAGGAPHPVKSGSLKGPNSAAPKPLRDWQHPKFVIVNGKVFMRFVPKGQDVTLPEETYYRRYAKPLANMSSGSPYIVYESDVLTPLEKDMLTSGEYEDATLLSPDGFERAVVASDRVAAAEMRARDEALPPPAYFENRGASDAAREWARMTNPDAPIINNIGGRLVDESTGNEVTIESLISEVWDN